jgi:hypothetical protein
MRTGVRVRHLLLSIALFSAGSLPARAADSPAQMVVGERSIEALLRIPGKLEPGRYEVQCEAFIDRGGFARYTRCYSMSAGPAPPPDLRQAVAYATRISRFAPAMRNGEPVDVWATLMVIVDTRSEEPLILAVPNNGADTARYGLLYTAPQRYGYTMFDRPKGRPHKAHREVVWVEFQIDEYGAMKDFRLTSDTEVPEDWVAWVRAAAQDFKFIPGQHEGKPVPMLYLEPLTWSR